MKDFRDYLTEARAAKKTAEPAATNVSYAPYVKISGSTAALKCSPDKKQWKSIQNELEKLFTNEKLKKIHIDLSQWKGDLEEIQGVFSSEVMTDGLDAIRTDNGFVIEGYGDGRDRTKDVTYEKRK
jgi:hypothetical protein